MTAKLTFRAPSRCHFRDGDGWNSRPWTRADVEDARRAGAWFAEGKHDFADSPAIRMHPATKPPGHSQALDALLRRLTPAERILLLAQLD